MQELTPAQVERELSRGRLDPAELPDLAARWLAAAALDTPALRELAGHPRSDVDGIRRLWAEVLRDLGVPPASSPESDQLSRAEFVHDIELLAAALNTYRDGLSTEATGLLLELWFALNCGPGPQIEGLSPDERSLIVRAYALYCDATDPLLDERRRREARAEAADQLRALTRKVLPGG